MLKFHLLDYRTIGLERIQNVEVTDASPLERFKLLFKNAHRSAFQRQAVERKETIKVRYAMRGNAMNGKEKDLRRTSSTSKRRIMIEICGPYLIWKPDKTTRLVIGTALKGVVKAGGLG